MHSINQKTQDRKLYDRVHHWISSNYGKAIKCENRESQILDFECTKDCEIYDWAKKDGAGYVKDIHEYLQLCRSCHSKYDGCGQLKEGQVHHLKGKTPHNKMFDYCQIDGCDRKHQAKGMCSSHYMKARRYATT